MGFEVSNEKDFYDVLEVIINFFVRELLIFIVYCFEKFVLYRIKRIFLEIENYFIVGLVGEGFFGFFGLFIKI